MIGVIFTGGTIGSTSDNGIIATDNSKSSVLIEMYEKKYCRADFIMDKPYEILSENLNFSYFGKLHKSVKAMVERGVEGIIVTHGSDTIQYTAAFLSYAFIEVDIPILVVCSNYVLDDARANGLDNFAAAVGFIKANAGAGVYIPYKRDNNSVIIYYGNAVHPHDIYEDGIRGVLGSFYGTYADNNFIRNGTDNPCVLKKIELPKVYNEYSGILSIDASPGIIYPSPKGYKAVLLYTYHSGTLCTDSEELVGFLSELEKNNIPLYIVGQAEKGKTENIYESLELIRNYSYSAMYNVSKIGAYIELYLSIK